MVEGCWVVLMSKSELTVNGRMLTDERRQRILSMVNEVGTVTSDELASVFAVSHMTIWRDLNVLEEHNLLRRVHGGVAKIEQNPTIEPFYNNKRVLNRTKKELIARYAADHFVHDGDIIILEAGTTVSAMVKFLKQRNLTVITNGLGTLNEITPSIMDINVMCCGGMLRDVSLTFVGPQAISYFSHIRVKTFFLGATGIAMPDGITDTNLLEIQVKQAMASSSECIVVLLDSSKFGKRSLATVIPLDLIDILVTDADAPVAELMKLEKLGIQVHIAK